MNRKRKAATIFSLLILPILFFVIVASVRPSLNPDKLLREVIRAANSKNRDDTRARLDEILLEWPEHAPTLLERVSYTDSEQEALSLLARVQSGPQALQTKARFFEGNLLLKQHRCRASISAFREAIRISPEDVGSRERVLPWLALLRRPAEVREQLQALRDIRGLTLAEMALWITADGKLTPFEEAETYLRGFLAADPDDEASLLALCVYLSEESREPEAIELLQSRIAKAPGSERVSVLLARLLMNSMRLSEAAEVLTELDAGGDFSDETWEAAGQYAFAVRDFEFARMASVHAAREAPFSRSRAYQVFRVLTALGEKEEAGFWKVRSELLNALHSEVETVGVAVSRRIVDPRPVERIAAVLEKLQFPVETTEWKRMLQSMNRNSGRGSHEAASEVSSSLNLTKQEQASGESAESSRALLAEWSRFRQALLLKKSVPAQDVREPTSSQFLLTERTTESGIDMKFENGSTGNRYLIETMGGGVLVLDIDHDGWPDVCFPQGGPLGEESTGERISDQLFRNRRNIRFANVTKSSGLKEFSYSLGGAVGDVNGDGFDDLFIADFGKNTLWLNQGDGTFEDITPVAGLDDASDMSTSAAFADLDGDGDLDLYVVNYVDGLKICRNDRQQIATCNPSSHKAVADALYENTGEGQFINRSELIGLESSAGKGLGVVVSRLNEDLRPDVFIANDTTPNLLYINQSVPGEMQFSEIGFSSGVAVNGTGHVQAGMGIACADLDHDLRMDLYVTNFHREANSLFLQTDPDLFQDLTTSAGLREPTLPRLGFGTQAVDLNLDGWHELFVTNGHIDDQREQGVEWQMAPQLFATVDGLRWSDVSLSSGSFFVEKALGRGVAVLDADRDGRPDLITGFQDRPVALVMNETASAGHFISLKLHGVRSNRDALNAVVYWEVQGKRMRTEMCGGNGYMCSNERRLILGLGPFDVADSVEIHWQDGMVQKEENVISGHYQVIQDRSFLTDPL